MNCTTLIIAKHTTPIVAQMKKPNKISITIEKINRTPLTLIFHIEQSHKSAFDRDDISGVHPVFCYQITYLPQKNTQTQKNY